MTAKGSASDAKRGTAPPSGLMMRRPTMVCDGSADASMMVMRSASSMMQHRPCLSTTTARGTPVKARSASDGRTSHAWTEVPRR
jgi:hypothetical protein